MLGYANGVEGSYALLLQLYISLCTLNEERGEPGAGAGFELCKLGEL